MRLIDADKLNWWYKGRPIRRVIDDAPTVAAVPVDIVAKMFYDFTGDLCPCNYSPWDEWLSERCELLDECPNPSHELGCWKQFVKHYAERKGNG